MREKQASRLERWMAERGMWYLVYGIMLNAGALAFTIPLISATHEILAYVLLGVFVLSIILMIVGIIVGVRFVTLEVMDEDATQQTVAVKAPTKEY